MPKEQQDRLTYLISIHVMGVSSSNGGLNFVAGLDLREFERNADRIESRIAALSKDVQKQSDQVEKFAQRAAAAAAAYFSISSATSFINKIIEVRGQFEQLQVAYTTILGSKQKADELFAQTLNLAKTTPFTLTEVAKSTKQLLAYGFGAEEVTGTLKKLGDVAAGVSAPIGDIAYLYGTLKTQGRAYAQDIRQFTGRGIPIIAELAKQFDTTSENVNKLVEAGKIGFPEVEKAINNLTGKGGQFFDLMREQSKTVTGQISNLKDSFDQLLNQIGKSNQGLIQGGIGFLNSLIENYSRIMEILEGLILVYGSYRAALIALTVETKLAALADAGLTFEKGLLRGAFALQAAALDVLNAKMVQGAITTAAYTAGIAAIAAIIYAVTANTNALSKSTENLNDIRKEGVKNSQAEIDKVSSLQRSISDLSNTEDQRLKAVKAIRDLMGERLKQYSDEEILAGKAKDAIKAYSEELLRNASLQAAQKKLTDLQEQLLNTDPRAQSGKSYEDRATAAFQNIPLRERLKLSLSNTFNENTLFGNQQTLRDYRNLIQDQIKGILNVYGKGIDDLNAGIQREGVSKAQQRAIDFAKALEKPIENFATLMKTQTGKLDLEAIGKALNDALDVPNITAQKINQIKGFQDQVDAALAVYSRKNDKKLANQEESEQQRRNAIFEKVAKINEDALANSKSQDDKEVLQARQKYDELLRVIDRFNNDKRNKTKIDPRNVTINGVKTDLVQGGNDAEALVRAQQSFEKEKQNIDALKTLYNEYEKYKLDVGQKAADERFKNDLKGYTSFVGYLEGLANGVAGKTDKLSIVTQDYLKTSLPAARKDAIKNTTEALSQLLTNTQTYEQKLLAAEDRYQTQRAALIASGHKDQVFELDRQHKEEVQSIADANAQKLESYKALFQGIEFLSEEQAKVVVANGEAMLAALQKDGKVSKELLLQIAAALKSAKKDISERLPNDLRGLSSVIGSLADGVAQFDAGFGKVLKTVSSVVAGVADIKSNMAILNSQDKNVSGLSKISAGLGIFGTAFGVLSTIGSLFTGSQKRAEQQAYAAQLQLKSTEAINKALERQLALNKELYGTQRLTAYAQSLNDISAAQEKALASLQSRYANSGDKYIDENYIAKLNNGENPNRGAFNRYDDEYDKIIKSGQAISLAGKSLEELQQLLEAGKLDERTAAIVNQLITLKQQYTDTFNTIRAESIGSTFDEQLDNIVSLFENATTSAEDFANNFQKIIQQSIINSFKRQFLETQLQGFYEKFAEFTDPKTSGGALNASEISQLEKMYNQIIEKAKQNFDDLEKATGVKFGSNDSANSQNSLQGSIRASLTEETGSILAGTLKGIQAGIYETNLILRSTNISFSQLLAIAQDTLDALIKIEANTLRTADNSDNLPDILNELKGIGQSSANSLSILSRSQGN